MQTSEVRQGWKQLELLKHCEGTDVKWIEDIDNITSRLTYSYLEMRVVDNICFQKIGRADISFGIFTYVNIHRPTTRWPGDGWIFRAFLED